MTMYALTRNGGAKCWLAYAAYISIAYGLGVFQGLVQRRFVSEIEVVLTIINGFGIAALWGLGLRKRISTQVFWRILFCVDLLLYIWTSVFPARPVPKLPDGVVFAVLLVFTIPYYSGVFIYAFRSPAIWRGTD